MVAPSLKQGITTATRGAVVQRRRNPGAAWIDVGEVTMWP
jgi:hypothetical protein